MPCLHPRIEMHHGALFIFSKLANKSDSRSFSSCALKSHSSPYQMCIYEKKNMIEITPNSLPWKRRRAGSLISCLFLRSPRWSRFQLCEAREHFSFCSHSSSWANVICMSSSSSFQGYSNRPKAQITKASTCVKASQDNQSCSKA